MEKFNYDEPLEVAQEGLETAIEKIYADLGIDGGYVNFGIEEDFKEIDLKYLSGVKTMMVDDQWNKVLVNAYMKGLYKITGEIPQVVGNLPEGINHLLEYIVNESPGLVLMDYSLKKSYTGEDLVRGLRQKGFQGLIVGHSSDRECNYLMHKAGAEIEFRKCNFTKESIKSLITSVNDYSANF